MLAYDRRQSLSVWKLVNRGNEFSVHPTYFMWIVTWDTWMKVSSQPFSVQPLMHPTNKIAMCTFHFWRFLPKKKKKAIDVIPKLQKILQRKIWNNENQEYGKL